ncbi:MAG: GNAT family N-acetyltransferase [Gemmatimonadaceae bacterium]
MPLAALHRNERPARPDDLAGMVVHHVTEPALMASIQGRTIQEMSRRLDAGHHAYVAYVHDVPAAWGWVATRSAEIGELGASFAIASAERYLWNFVTAPAFRGRGIYPRLLAHIIDAESRDAEWFWIAWAPENHASGKGIRRAGFTPVAELSFDANGLPALHDMQPGGAALAAGMLGLPEAEEKLAQCWRCARAKKSVAMSCAEDACRCDYQVPASGCAA